jgi:predicted TIM-barrel fold metal-dependent hydrolase
MRVVDSDGHVIEPPRMWKEYLATRYHAEMPRPTKDEHGRFCYAVGDTHVMRTARELAVPFKNEKGEVTRRELPSGGWDPEARLRDMDTEGIDVAVLYPTLAFFFPEIKSSELHAALCRAYNDWLADYVQKAPERLVGVALLPLEDVAASVRELERATEEHGFRGAFLRPNPYRGRALHDPDYDPVWECAQSLGVPITVHEGISDSLPTIGRERSSNPVVQHLMSHPFEQMSACASILLEGVATRFPRLTFVFLESGSGWLPYWLDRMDSHWETWRALLPRAAEKPSDAFRRQCFIAMDPEDEMAASVARLVGDDILVWSSDYPHPDSPFPGAVKKTLETLGKLPAASQRKILGENGLRLYGIF